MTLRNKKPYIIAINAISGGGKTTLAKHLAESLPQSMRFSFDDFEETNLYPDNFCAWSKRGANLLEFDCLGMYTAVEEVIQKETLKYIILDYPFGRDHPRFRTLIDLSVFIDTPLDVALIRRILRDYATTGESSEDFKNLKKELADYLDKARYPYLDAMKLKETSDLILNGLASINDLKDEIIRYIKT